MPPPKAGSPSNKDAGNGNPRILENTRTDRENSSERSEASTASQTSPPNDPCRDEGREIHARENGPTAPEDYAYNRELAIQEGVSDYWRDAVQTSTAKCLNCGRLIAEPWWTTLLVPEAVLCRRPLCSSFCLLEYCSTQKWNDGILEMSVDYPGVSGNGILGYWKMRRCTIRLDITQAQLRAQLNQFQSKNKTPLPDQLRLQLDKLHSLATRAPEQQGNTATETVFEAWAPPQYSRTEDRYFRTETVLSEPAGRTAKRPHEGVTRMRNTKAKDTETKSAPSRIRAIPVTEATIQAVIAGRMGLPPACPAVPKRASFHQNATGHRSE